MAHRVPLPTRSGPFTATGGALATILARFEANLYQWAERLALHVVPLSKYRGVGAPFVADFTAVHGDHCLYDPTAGAITVEIPDPSVETYGQTIKLTRTTSDTSNLTIHCVGSYLQGTTSYVTAAAWATVILRDIGDQWAVEAPAA